MKRLYATAAIAAMLLSCTKGEPAPESNPSQEDVPAAPELGYEVSPTGGNVYTDTEIRLEFDSAPQLGNSGAIRIFTSDGDEVDCIMMEDVIAEKTTMDNNTIYNTAMDILEASPGSTKYYRTVHYTAVRIEGNSVVIKPHCSVLNFNTEYYITIDPEAIEAPGFEGVEKEEWAFLTKVKPASETEVSVGKSGNTDFRTVQGALNYTCRSGQSAAVTINIQNGSYDEPLFLCNKDNVTLKGMSRSGVILQYSNCESLTSGVGSSTDRKPSRGNAIGRSGGRAVILMEDCDNIRFENMTLQNTWSGERSQAEVIYFNSRTGEDRLVLVNCNIGSRQDTINAKGYGWFYNCSIEGNVDFIWGSPETILFEKCDIRTISDEGFSRGYIVQCRCLEADAIGFVFLGCTINSDSGVPDGSVYLARSSGSSDYYDNVTYAGCRIGPAVAASGWYSDPAPNPSSPSATRGWKEYGTTDMSGSSADLSGRYGGSLQLSETEYSEHFKDRSVIFSGCPKGTDWLAETI